MKPKRTKEHFILLFFFFSFSFLFSTLLPHLHEFFFQFSEQNLYWNIAPLRSARIFLSNESLFAQNWFRTRELCPFYPSAAICPDEFQNAQRPMFLPYLLVRVFKFIDLECVGMRIWWSFWISTFCFFVQLWTCSQIDENSCILLGFRRCWRSWLKFFWSWTHGSASSCLQNILNTHYPRGDGRE